MDMKVRILIIASGTLITPVTLGTPGTLVTLVTLVTY